MTTMTAPQLLTIRRRTGDTAATPLLTDTEIDTIYLDTTLGNRDMASTTYFALLDLYGLTLALIDKSNQVDNLFVKSSQQSDHYAKAIEFWGKQSGQTDIILSMGIAEGGVTLGTPNDNWVGLPAGTEPQT